MLGKLLKPGPRYGWRKIGLIISLSTFCISGGASAALLFYSYSQNLHATSQASVIQTIVQSTGHYLPLQTTYLAEVLELCRDRPANLSQFDLERAQRRLMATHLIQEALLKKIKPNNLLIKYKVREPIAFLGDYTNTALDGEGALFPYLPFYPPRHLPEVYLGVHAPPGPWGETIRSDQIEMVKNILARFEIGRIKRIDLSQMDAATLGQRQVVLALKEGKLLRLTPKNYLQELTHYFMLEKQLSPKAQIVDFRNANVAYINYGK